MGYVCPVCEGPQADAEHLANHLAFTAMLRGDDHAAWLDDHAPEWEDLGPAALAERVTDDAEETEYPQVFEDTTDDGHGHHGHEHGRHDHGNQGAGAPGRSGRSETGGGLDGAPGGVADVDDALGGDDVDPDDVLAEARELTRQRRERASGGADASDGDSQAGSDEGGGDADTDDGEAGDGAGE